MAMKNNAVIMDQVCKAANSLFPELNVRPSDVANPTEAFLVRILIPCLRAYGFRVEPPYNIESDANDSSKVKRIFLTKLCRQVQKILQISFPGKSYTYYDIIQPTAKTTLNTLDVLFNYWCFYRMHKKNIIQPIIERVHERQALTAINAAKRNELEQQQQSGVQDKIELKECEANIRKLNEELPHAKADLSSQSKVLRQLQSDMAVNEELESQLQTQLNGYKQLVVLDSDVAAVKMETQQLSAQIESCKPEMEKQQQIFNERRQEIEEIAQLSQNIDIAATLVQPEVPIACQTAKKSMQRIEQTHEAIVKQHQGLLDSKQKLQQLVAESELKLKAFGEQCEKQEAQQQQQQQALQAAIEQQTVEIANLQQQQIELQQQMEQEQ
ncbi:hypothetical protein KR044_007244, partial [Drosophila immigrans]